MSQQRGSGKLTAQDPRRIGKFTITGLLGEGGMGRVYRARQKGLAREVALKVMSPALAQDAEHVARFDREARAAAALQHPNVVKVIDAGLDPATERRFIAFELVEGVELEAELVRRGGTINERQGLLIARSVCSALHAAHQLGIIHRDIKPANVLISKEGPKLVDLGLAKPIKNADQSLTATGIAIGTPDYMAPEQAAGERKIDGRTDIYALGIMLFRMVTGKVPFEATSVVASLARRMSEDVPDPRTLRPDVSEGFAALIAFLCARNLKTRCPTAGHALEAINALLSEQHGGATSSQSLRTVQPRRRSALPALLFTLAVFSAMGWAVWHFVVKPSRERAKQGQSQSQGEGGPATTATAIGPAPAGLSLSHEWGEPERGGIAAIGFAPAGARAFVVWRGGRAHVFTADAARAPVIIDVKDEEGKPLTTSAAALDPTGAWLVIGDDRGRIHLYDASSAAHATTVDVGAELVARGLAKDGQLGVGTITRDHDGQHLFVSNGSVLSRWKLGERGAAPTLVERIGEHPANAPIIDVVASGDGHWLLTADAAGRALLWDRRVGGRAERLHRPERADDDGSPEPVSVAVSADSRRALIAFAPADARSGKLLRLDLDATPPAEKWIPHPEPIHGLALSPTGRFAVLGTVGAPDALLAVLAIDDPAGQQPVAPHPTALERVAWSADGTRALSATADGTARLFEVAWEQDGE